MEHTPFQPHTGFTQNCLTDRILNQGDVMNLVHDGIMDNGGMDCIAHAYCERRLMYHIGSRRAHYLPPRMINDDRPSNKTYHLFTAISLGHPITYLWPYPSATPSLMAISLRHPITYLWPYHSSTQSPMAISLRNPITYLWPHHSTTPSLMAISLLHPITHGHIPPPPHHKRPYHSATSSPMAI